MSDIIQLVGSHKMSSSTTIAIFQCESSYLTTFDQRDIADWIWKHSLNTHNYQFWNVGTICSGDEVAWISAKFFTTGSSLPTCKLICHFNVIVLFLFPFNVPLIFTFSPMTWSWWGWVNICKNLRSQTENAQAHVKIQFCSSRSVISEKDFADDDIFLLRNEI